MDDISEYLSNFSPSWRIRALMKRPDFLERIKSAYPDSIPESEIAFLFVHNLTFRPTCANCGGTVSFFGSRYAKTCSRACDVLSRSEEYRISNAQRLKNLSKSDYRKNKTRNTMLSRYGSLVTDKSRASSSARSAELNTKGRETIKKKYGVDHPSQIRGAAEKSLKTKKDRKERYDLRRLDKLREKYQGVIPETIVSLRLPETTEANVRFDISCDCGATYEIPYETLKFRMARCEKTCAKCAGLTLSNSISETEVADYMQSLTQIRRNDRKIISPYELDVICDEEKIAIEFCGLYWHSELAGKTRFYHQHKLSSCEEKGFKLITIFEDEWLYNRDIVKSMLSNAIGKTVMRVGARQCSVEILPSRVAREFLKNNHIQGAGRAKHYIGLVHDSKIVSVMSFSKGEISRRQPEWEINRFCSALNTIVHGAASRLFLKFVEIEKPDIVISYADRRWGSGRVYENIGFILDKNTLPNYWYFKGLNRKHRYGLRKRSDEPKGETEWNLRQAEGWNRIWDCGHTKWIWKNT